MGFFQQIKIPMTSEIIITTESVDITLKNNTLYFFSNAAITAIDIDAENDMKYSGFDFQTGNTAPTFTTPHTWAFQGSDCTDGEFVPVKNATYRIAIERGFDTFIGTVQKCEFRTTEN